MLVVLPFAVAFANGPTAASTPIPRPAASASIVANDNRTPAGTLAGKVLTVHLEARAGIWRPEGPKGAGLAVAAWAESGKPLTNPGPLLRVAQGNTVHATVRNTLDRTLVVTGLSATHATGDTLMLAPGASREVSFVAGTPGTYFYTARSASASNESDTQLNGAIVIDAAGVAPSPDRVFVMSWWFTIDEKSPSGLGRGTMAINGLSWPHTERIDLTQGDSVRWRVVNLTASDHPMHLHGFYFQVQRKGDGVVDTAYTADQRRMAVTEVLDPGQTMSMAWVPARPGNWIFHCHYAGHLGEAASLDTKMGAMDEMGMMQHASDRPHQMYGLVLGLRVKPKGPQVAAAADARPIRLLVRQKPGVYGNHAGYAFVLGGTKDAADAAALPAPPGPTLVLQKDQRVAITIVNQTKDRAAVHWHGIELESFPDGVPGWSGANKEILPSVGPGDSITVRFTPPRVGTFMYHSHFNEDHQITGGLYGAIVVVEKGRTALAENDRLLFFSSAGPTTNVVFGPYTPTMLNGAVQPEPMELRAGTTYRFRMIDMTGDLHTIVDLLDGDTHLNWRAVAKDGADLPPSQATVRPAKLQMDPGEIYDFEFTPQQAGTYTLRFGPEDTPPDPSLPKKANVVVRVR